MKSYTIHLISHGLTDGNTKGQYIGSTDVPLAPEGLTQLLQLKERFQYPNAASASGRGKPQMNCKTIRNSSSGWKLEARTLLQREKAAPSFKPAVVRPSLKWWRD